MFAFVDRNTWKKWAIRWTGLLTLSLALWVGNPVAAQNGPGPSPFLNLQHTLAIRKAFLQDKELARLNLGVKVESRIAYLWGAVPSSQALNRAVKAVKGIPDILEIRNNL